MLEYCRLSVGSRESLEPVLKQLLAFGYERVDAVADPGEVALRGGILDLFPATFESPVRLEWDGSRLNSIRSFNPQTLETLDRHTMLVVLPRQVHSRVSAQVPFEAFLDLREGQYVVHLDHGIGRYLRRATIEGSQGPQETLVVEYAGGDLLYVPIDQVHLLQTYVAFGGRSPALHTLGGTAWERAKVNAYVGAWTYAKALLDVHAKRLALPGHACAKDHDWQRAFEAMFPYRETPDQLTAVADVKRDMEASRPMDRLLLGDVGYGKTEVALRAAFKAVMDQRQVAVLVPTTILAYQHYRTFAKRVGGFPIRVEMLSRFQSEAEQRQIARDVAGGAVDIVIGTHRLLSGDIRFNALGLLIVDEEQRFGVQDKERLKQWRSQMDVLTLSATPIPRTLYLALVGARELSMITTPPENRHPIATQILEKDDASLRRWVLRELKRGGQVYVVHNRVHNIYRVAGDVSALVPEARVGIAHGQMGEAELQQAMMAFMEGAVDVLVTTTIIESGIDIPNANTLIVNDAESFGLADLYQLR
ncbi:MAG: DEAD/DEAH box helicase, partial [Candidatus Omnitrophica bacterium]|nr:DEAD/DEAH box helicase [Candidatus Omnitrophota bacterium]